MLRTLHGSDSITESLDGSTSWNSVHPTAHSRVTMVTLIHGQACGGSLATRPGDTGEGERSGGSTPTQGGRTLPRPPVRPTAAVLVEV